MSSNVSGADRQLVRTLLPELTEAEVDRYVARIQFERTLRGVKAAYPEMSEADQAVLASLQPEESVTLSDGSEAEYIRDATPSRGWFSRLFRWPR